MQSDLLSGGLEPHLFCLFEESDLRKMLVDAQAGLNSEIATLIEEAIAGKQRDLQTEILTD